MNKEELKERIENKATSKISFINLEIKSLKNQVPTLAFTEEMINGLILFKQKDLTVWKQIKLLNK